MQAAGGSAIGRWHCAALADHHNANGTMQLWDSLHVRPTMFKILKLRPAGQRMVHRYITSSPACALQVQDLEAALQETALSSVHDVLLAQAAAAAPKAFKSGSASDTEAARRLRVLLGCLSVAGNSVHAFLSHACLALHTKKRLPARAAAAGLQAVIDSSGTCWNSL
jgi:hypothetical protein